MRDMIDRRVRAFLQGLARSKTCVHGGALSCAVQNGESEVCNGAVLEVATNRLHFEPVESACGLRRSRQAVAEGRVDSVGRGSDNFDHAQAWLLIASPWVGSG
jgi:hypothetical protein